MKENAPIFQKIRGTHFTELKADRRYKIPEEKTTHIGVRSGKIGFFICDREGIVFYKSLKGWRFIIIPFPQHLRRFWSVQFANYSSNHTGHRYGIPVWHKLKSPEKV